MNLESAVLTVPLSLLYFLFEARKRLTAVGTVIGAVKQSEARCFLVHMLYDVDTGSELRTCALGSFCFQPFKETELFFDVSDGLFFVYLAHTLSLFLVKSLFMPCERLCTVITREEEKLVRRELFIIGIVFCLQLVKAFLCVI